MTGDYNIRVVVPESVQTTITRVLGRVGELFTTTESPNEPGGAESEGSRSVDLYSCEDCRTTYIQDDMQSCPECGEAVDRTPTFAELGIGPDAGD